MASVYAAQQRAHKECGYTLKALNAAVSSFR